MRKYTISLIVRNNPGVLSRVSGVFTRRAYNLNSISASKTADEKVSRMTIELLGDEITLELIMKQLEKLVDTIKVVELKSSNSLLRELVLVKVNIDDESRKKDMNIRNLLNVRVLEVTPRDVTYEFTGSIQDADRFLKSINAFEVIELTRSGATGIMKSS